MSPAISKVWWRIVDDHERLARQFFHEMQDELGQTQAGLRGMLASGNDPAQCVAVVDEVLQEVRKLSQVMRPVVLDDFGVTSALSWLTERFRQRIGTLMIF
jgi:signal transduction histidine kinase